VQELLVLSLAKEYSLVLYEWQKNIVERNFSLASKLWDQFPDSYLSGRLLCSLIL
jgi:hypothetical protein